MAGPADASKRPSVQENSKQLNKHVGEDSMQSFGR
jgi:hypothetical protein